MRLLSAFAILGFAALNAGCAIHDDTFLPTLDPNHLLSLADARNLRADLATYGGESYWRPAEVIDLPSRHRNYRPASDRIALGDFTGGRDRNDEDLTRKAREEALQRLESSLEPHAAQKAQEPRLSVPPAANLTATQTSPAPNTEPPVEIAIVCSASDSACSERLASLRADDTHAWIFSPPSQEDYESGTRLLAYHAMRAQMSCTELKLAVIEATTTLDKLAAQAYGQGIAESKKLKLQSVLRTAIAIKADVAESKSLKCLKQ
ncbi:MAG: hypothetical protein KDJ47_12175 [Hyphomicrobiaceae bacterium]|nr:hypothetical protein [Hyphomicrobiaceae bacterium]